MLLANNIDRKSWIKYDSNSDFPIQNIPFGVFKTNNNEFHIATIIGKTIISLKNLEKAGYFNEIELHQNTFQEKNFNVRLLICDKNNDVRVKQPVKSLYPLDW